MRTRPRPWRTYRLRSAELRAVDAFVVAATRALAPRVVALSSLRGIDALSFAESVPCLHGGAASGVRDNRSRDEERARGTWRRGDADRPIHSTVPHCAACAAAGRRSSCTGNAPWVRGAEEGEAGREMARGSAMGRLNATRRGRPRRPLRFTPFPGSPGHAEQRVGLVSTRRVRIRRVRVTTWRGGREIIPNGRQRRGGVRPQKWGLPA